MKEVIPLEQYFVPNWHDKPCANETKQFSGSKVWGGSHWTVAKMNKTTRNEIKLYQRDPTPTTPPPSHSPRILKINNAHLCLSFRIRGKCLEKVRRLHTDRFQVVHRNPQQENMNKCTFHDLFQNTFWLSWKPIFLLSGNLMLPRTCLHQLKEPQK